MSRTYEKYGFCLLLHFAATLSSDEEEELFVSIIDEVTSAGWGGGAGGEVGEAGFFVIGEEREVTPLARTKFCTWVSELKGVTVCKSTGMMKSKDMLVHDDELNYEYVYEC